MIIVEGPDGSGKSSLIARLEFERQTFKSLTGGVGGDTPHGWSLPGQGVVEAYLSKVDEATAQEYTCRHCGLPGIEEPHGDHKFARRDIAFDRFHLSEVVYGPLLRGRQLLPDLQFQRLHKFLVHRKIVVILCLPTFATTLANVAKEGRERPAYQTEGFLHQAYKGFEQLTSWVTYVHRYDQDSLLSTV